MYFHQKSGRGMYEHAILQGKDMNAYRKAVPSGMRRQAVPSDAHCIAVPSGEGGDPQALRSGRTGLT